jgi:hypothetical protein
MLNAEADDPACEHVHHHHDSVAAQECRFAAEQIDTPQTILELPRRSARTDRLFLTLVDSTW